MKYPFIRPSPPRLSQQINELIALENSGIFSNFGPINSRFEKSALATFFGGSGAITTVNNATTGLILAIEALLDRQNPRRRYAVMPSFTFAATAAAAEWCGLEPLFIDIDPDTWLPSVADLEERLRSMGDEIAVVVPYATFGNGLALEHLDKLCANYKIPMVVDAAASLGTRWNDDQHFGANSTWPIVFSMHVTKAFGTSEAGLVYCHNKDMIDRIRALSNFGFDADRRVVAKGLNGKLSELAALVCDLRLATYPKTVSTRALLAQQYKETMHNVTFQKITSKTIGYQFMPVLLPSAYGKNRADICRQLSTAGIETRSYFSPALHQQEYYQRKGIKRSLPITDEISQRIVGFPLYDSMTTQDIDEIVGAFHRIIRGQLLVTSA